MKATAWLLGISGLLVIFIAAINHKGQLTCTGVDIEVNGEGTALFIDSKEVIRLLGGDTEARLKGKPLKNFDLKKMEQVLERNVWIRNAELYFSNQLALTVKIDEARPVARIFTNQGSSYYIDSSGSKLPLSDKLSARLPVFTGFPTERENLGKADSILLKRVMQMADILNTNEFWQAQIAQVDITSDRQFELYPLLGDHVIEMGYGENLGAQFNRLLVFYKGVLAQSGLDTYSRIKVQFDKQVIGVKQQQQL